MNSGKHKLLQNPHSPGDALCPSEPKEHSQ
jgi:hypothetical protein